MDEFYSKEIEEMLDAYDRDRDDSQLESAPEEKKRKRKCECGAEKTYGKDAPHSSWCPKYEEVPGG